MTDVPTSKDKLHRLPCISLHGRGQTNTAARTLHSQGPGPAPKAFLKDGPCVTRRVYSARATSELYLSEHQKNDVQTLRRLKTRLQFNVLHSQNQPNRPSAILSIDDVVGSLLSKSKEMNNGESDMAQVLQRVYQGRDYLEVKNKLDLVLSHSHSLGRPIRNEDAIKVLDELGLLTESAEDKQNVEEKKGSKNTAKCTTDEPPTASSRDDKVRKSRRKKRRLRIIWVRSRVYREQLNPSRRPISKSLRLRPRLSNIRQRRTERLKDDELDEPKLSQSPDQHIAGTRKTPGKRKELQRLANLDSELLQTIHSKDLTLNPLETTQPKVPKLSFDLSRVLFNQGVYQLQDPRSRVFNFDPYLAQIMPVSEFNYDALNKFVTSSEDEMLQKIANEHKKRYIGSSSSMSSTLSHFHFLLSAWRAIDLKYLSRDFRDEGTKFTKIQRGPTAIFLRWKDGVYAVDADKEFDSGNILMSLGKSMEKLLTLEKDEFERYRKSNDSTEQAVQLETDPEAYHYTEFGQFLLRSQLDAHDPRLPGTGMFDLKTRAVAAIRMNVRQHERGLGYQIRERLGTWESYEREYYDMIRSAFLKYSLQVRMGRMDGIFVAYHNVERIFGFQYVPLPELDGVLHGQQDRTLGDREFCLSIEMLNQVFNRATEEFPEQSLRLHFETREPTITEPSPFMYIFAEPVAEEEIQQIQDLKKQEIAAYEERIFNPEKAQAMNEIEGVEDTASQDAQREDLHSIDEVSQASSSVASNSDTAFNPTNEIPHPNTEPVVDSSTQSSIPSNAADVDFLDKISSIDVSKDLSSPNEELKPILGMKLHIRNVVNEKPVIRPQGLSNEDEWKVEYTFTPLRPALAWRQYKLCKNRRKKILMAPQESDAAVSYYLRRLIEMSKKGAEWRRQQDELDAQRETVVLYQN